MGVLNSKQWAEVLTTGSPGSPDATQSRIDSDASPEHSPIPADSGDSKGVEAEEEDRPRPRHRNLKNLDPRSVSDDINRTPIQKSPESKMENNSDAEEEPDTSGQGPIL